MAYSVTFQPQAGLRLSRSPLISVALETDTVIRNAPTFRYFCRVQVYSGAPTPFPAANTFNIATLLRTPDPEGYGVFDVSPLMDSIISQLGANSTATNDNQRLRNVRLRFGYFLNGTETLLVTGDYFQIADGFALQQQPINGYKDSAAIILGERFLVPQERMFVARDQDAWVHIYVNQDQDRRVQYRLPNGTQPFTVNLPASTRLWRLPIGVDAVNAISTNVNFTANNGFLIGLIDSVTAQEYQQIRIDVLDRAFCDIPSDSIAYINRFGAWDYLHVRGQKYSTVTQERTEWDRRIGRVDPDGEYTYNIGTSQVGVTEVIGMESIVFNTGFVRADSINEKIRDLMLSRVYFSLVLNQPLLLNKQSIQLRNDSESDLINYELEFKVAGNLIQSIR